jgi:lipooligosaccharide transport system permease protein
MLPSRLAVAVWRRNFLSWRRYMASFVVSALGGPIFYLIAIGYGVGRYVGELGGVPYSEFLAPGLVATAAMNSASFEATFGAYTRMAEQDTYTALLATPCTVADVVAGEVLWAGSKAVLGVALVLLVTVGLGLMSGPFLGPPLVLLLAVGFLSGLAFGALGMVVTAFAGSYNFFEYYFTLVISVMFVFSGVFYPVETLPAWGQGLAWMLPLTHTVRPSRLLAAGHLDWQIAADVVWLLVVTVVAFCVAERTVRRRLQQ